MATSAQFSTTAWPKSAVAFRGDAPLNGTPAGPKDNLVTLGGYIDPADANNTPTVYPFGWVVSALPTTPDALVVGKPTSGYFIRGILMQDESILYNEPMKPDSYLLGAPATFMQNGKLLYTNWTATASGALTNPNISSIPIFNTASGFIEFVAYGTSTAPAGFSFITKPNGTDKAATVTRTDLLFGNSAAGGVEISLELN